MVSLERINKILWKPLWKLDSTFIFLKWHDTHPTFIMTCGIQNIFAFVYFVITFPIIRWGGDWTVKDLDYGQRHEYSNFDLDIL
jgi:hypothetical protein